ncbi:MAG: ATP-dependent Lon protease [Myxococcota bacterium]|jgi:ATP-dependent Lon protease
MHATPVALAVRGLVVFPGAIRMLAVGRRPSRLAIDAHLDNDEPLVLTFQLDGEVEDPLRAELAPVGVLARVLRSADLPDGTSRVLVEGLERAWIRGPLHEDDAGATRVAIEQLITDVADPVKVAAAARQIRTLYGEIMEMGGMTPSEQDLLLAEADDPERLADQVVGALELAPATSQRLLAIPTLDERIDRVLDEVVTVLAERRLAADVQARVAAAMDKSQRDYHLREQLRAIRTELGESTTADAEADAFRDRIMLAGMPPEVQEQGLREADRLRRMHTESAEYTLLRTWLETLCDVPWSTSTRDTISLPKAQRVLDRDHHGLDRVKERVLEYLAVRQLAPESKGPILCFVGPPGVGKTSLGRSIARALGRAFARIALGGVKDETEVRGHRRTYVGAMPGRFVRALIRAGSRNPVIVLDELDKVGNDVRGDPASALLEVLDPEQNVAFVDHYLDLPLDLSQVLFIATANLSDPIPAALYDRLEIIELPGYTEEEKVQIARRFLLPRLGKAHGLGGDRIQVDSAALRTTIRDYTREAGVRELERQLAKVHRKVARKVVEGRERRMRLTDRSVQRFLGPPRYQLEVAERVDQPGVVIGLAWTAAGGDILFVEAACMPGTASLKLTGSLGDIMKESVEAAMSWLRANGARYDIAPEAFQLAFHLHVPAGAIPKDGPSAGVTMATALASAITGRPVRPRLAMTGEITLRGRVLQVGGVKEKVLAARRAGITHVILPRRNENDLIDIPAELRSDLQFSFVDTVDEVLALALMEA